MFKIILCVHLFVLISIVLCEDEAEEEVNKIESLCERPTINAADRMINNTVRLYRGTYYWTLNGLPAESGTLDGPFKIPFKKMGSIFRNNTVVTLLGGTDRGKTVKTEGHNYWLWDDKGNMKTDINGLTHNRFPSGGFEAAIHDANMDDPTLIGFKGIKVYYFSTRYRVWTIDKKPSGYYGGKYNESFPTDLSAAFTLPADNPKDQYIAYFFKRDKYCKRPKVLKSGKDCDQWLPNKLLFGCDKQINERKPDIESDSAEKELPFGRDVGPISQTVASTESVDISTKPSSADPSNTVEQSTERSTEHTVTQTVMKNSDITEGSSVSPTPTSEASLTFSASFAITFVLSFIRLIFV